MMRTHRPFPTLTPRPTALALRADGAPTRSTAGLRASPGMLSALLVAGIAVVFSASPAAAQPQPSLSRAPLVERALPAVDPYQPYVAKRVHYCHPNTHFAEQPGVVEFRDMVMSRVGGGDYGIFACSGYEHEEGRAWDWKMNAAIAAEAEAVDRVLRWLTANGNEMARRIGLAYLIWDDRYLGLSAGDPHGWEDYLACRPGQSSASVCHTNHVHFAFSWAGARRQTTWFTFTPRPPGWYPPAPAH